MGKFTDRVGMKYGELTVIKMERNHRDKVAWVCKCTCGNITKPIVGGNLTSGNTTRCNDHPFLIDLTGNRYGKLTVLGYSHTENKRVMWKVRCDCGVEKCYRSDMLQDKFKSCGCSWNEAHNMIDGIVLHKTNWYSNFNAAKSRTTHKSNPSYEHYDKLIQGVKIEPKWIENPVLFIEHIGEKPSPTHSIDRIDNTKGYIEGNVRWATYEEQMVNTRKKTYHSVESSIELKLIHNITKINPYEFEDQTVLYSFYNELNECMYVGYTTDLNTTIMNHLSYRSTMSKSEIDELARIEVAIIDREDKPIDVKTYAVDKLKPKYVGSNIKVKDNTYDLKWQDYTPCYLYNKHIS